MATVKIYPRHAPLVARLITSANTRGNVGAAATGPFRHLREAYVFAASLGIAEGTASEAGTMEKFKENPGHAIVEDIFFKAAGAAEMVTLLAMLPEGSNTELTDDLLAERVGELSNNDFAERFETLDRYAYRGFEIIAGENGNVPVRDTLMACLAKIKPEAHGEEAIGDVDAIEQYLYL